MKEFKLTIDLKIQLSEIIEAETALDALKEGPDRDQSSLLRMINKQVESGKAEIKLVGVGASEI